MQHLVELEFMRVEGKGARFELRIIEDVVDEAEEMLPALANVADIIGQLRRIAPGPRQAQQQFRKADDGVQGRAQFMAHGGQEPRARTGRELRRMTRFVQLFQARCACSTVSSRSFAMVPIPLKRPSFVTRKPDWIASG